MTHVICLAGPSDAAKAQVMESLAAELESRGLRVGFIRALSNPATGGMAMELPAMALRLELRSDPGMTVEELAARYLDDADIVISEVYQGVKRAKLEYLPDGSSPELVDDPGLKAVLTGQAEVSGLLTLSLDAVKVADFILAEMMPKGEPSKVRVFLGGKRMPMKDFVQDMVGDTAKAMIGALRGGDRAGRLMIIVED